MTAEPLSLNVRERIAPEPELRYEIRWSDGSRFDCRRKVSAVQAQQLIDAKICDPVNSASGILRYLQMRRNPSVKRFANILAQADFTICQTVNLYEHITSKRRGF